MRRSVTMDSLRTESRRRHAIILRTVLQSGAWSGTGSADEFVTIVVETFKNSLLGWNQRRAKTHPHGRRKWGPPDRRLKMKSAATWVVLLFLVDALQARPAGGGAMACCRRHRFEGRTFGFGRGGLSSPTPKLVWGLGLQASSLPT